MTANANSYVPGTSGSFGWTTSDWQDMRVTDGDLIPGSPYDVARFGQQLSTTAKLIQSQIDSLNNMADGEGWDSDSGKKFQSMIGDTVKTLGKVLERYNAATAAIGTTTLADHGRAGSNWAAQLQYAQDQVSKALSTGAPAAGLSLSYYNQIATALQQASAAAAKSSSGTKPANPLLTVPPGTLTIGPGGPTAEQIATSTDPTVIRLRGLKHNEDTAVDQATSQIEAAINFRDSMAKAAAKAIESEINKDGLRDPHGFWHDVADAIAEVGHVMGALSAVFGLLALICSFVPFLAPLAAVFGALAMITGVIGLVCDTISALDGHGTWVDVGIDLIAVISCGAGKTIGESAELVSRAGEADEAVSSFNMATKMAKYLDQGFKPSTIMKVIGGDSDMIAAGDKLIGDGKTLAGLTQDADSATAAASAKGWGATLQRIGANSFNPTSYISDIKGVTAGDGLISKGVFDPDAIKGAASVLPFKSTNGLAVINGLSASAPLIPAWANLAPDPADPGFFQGLEPNAFDGIKTGNSWYQSPG